MMDAHYPAVTVGIVTYNRRRRLEACLASVAAQSVRPAEVLVVDNGSSDDTVAWLAAAHPDVRVLALGENLGPAGARNRLLQTADTELVLLVDDDVLLERHTLARLIDGLAASGATVAAPLLVHADRPDVVQYAGFDVHFLCVGISRGGTRAELEWRAPYRVAAVAGAALLVRRRAALAAGGFDERFAFHREDGEFCARVTQAGGVCVIVPSAVARHDLSPRPEAAISLFLRNRWLYMLKLYSARTLLVAGPALLAVEIAVLALLLLTGRGGRYLSAVREVWRALPTALAARRDVQARRCVPDGAWLTAGRVAPFRALTLAPVAARAAACANALADAYWRLLGPLAGNVAADAPREAGLARSAERWQGVPVPGAASGPSTAHPAPERAPAPHVPAERPAAAA
jgi:GT2 family glycosyltransferase